MRFNCSSPSNSGSCSVSVSGSGNQTQTADWSTATAAFDYLSYVSTKVRAKSGKRSACYFFVEQEGVEGFFRAFTKFKQIESTLIQSYSRLIQLNRPILSSTNSVQETLTSSSVSSTSKRSRSNQLNQLTIQNCIYFLNKYCLRLPSDSLTQLTPSFESVRNEQDQKFKCILRLPINSGVREEVESAWMPSLNSAKLDAAYKTCLVLFVNNECNAMLEPITKEIFYRQKHRADADDLREWSQFAAAGGSGYDHENSSNSTMMTAAAAANYHMAHRPGGTKRKQVYTRKVSAYVNNLQLVSTSQSCCKS